MDRSMGKSDARLATHAIQIVFLAKPDFDFQ